MLKNGNYAIYIGDPLDPTLGMIPYVNSVAKILRFFSRAMDTGCRTFIIELIDGNQALVSENELLDFCPKPSWEQIEASTGGYRPRGLTNERR